MTDEWTSRLQDAILSNSGLRDGLTDEEAQPLIDWGLREAQTVGAKLAAMLPEAAEMEYETQQDALLKIMTRINWLAMYRAQKGADWFNQTLQKLNELNLILKGEAAPRLPDDVIATYVAQPDQLSNGQLVLNLINYLTPPPLMPGA